MLAHGLSLVDAELVLTDHVGQLNHAVCHKCHLAVGTGQLHGCQRHTSYYS